MIGTMKGQQPSQLQNGRASLRTANPELANSRRAGAQGTGLKMSEQTDPSQGERSPEPWKINLPSVDLSKKYGVPVPQTQGTRTITQGKKVIRLKSLATHPRTRSVKVLTWWNLVLATGCCAMVLTVMGGVRGNSELETMTSEFSQVTDAKSLRRALLIRPKNHGPAFSVRSMLLLVLLATVMVVVIMSDGSEAGGSIHHRRLGFTSDDAKIWCSVKLTECGKCLEKCTSSDTKRRFNESQRTTGRGQAAYSNDRLARYKESLAARRDARYAKTDAGMRDAMIAKETFSGKLQRRLGLTKIVIETTNQDGMEDTLAEESKAKHQRAINKRHRMVSTATRAAHSLIGPGPEGNSSQRPGGGGRY